MDCRSCGVVNAPGRRYCRECGGRLGQSCPVCLFFNVLEDKYCGGCGRRLQAGTATIEEEPAQEAAYAPALSEDHGLDDVEIPTAPAVGTGIAGQGVSQSEIDGLFENILEDEPEEGGA